MAFDISQLSPVDQDRCYRLGRRAVLRFLESPDNTDWFNAIAASPALRWHGLLSLGLGVQSVHFGKRIDEQFTRDFITYFAKKHMIREEDDPSGMVDLMGRNMLGNDTPRGAEAAVLN
jgi:hypothetical protein